jgi:hypothetical protein
VPESLPFDQSRTTFPKAKRFIIEDFASHMEYNVISTPFNNWNKNCRTELKRDWIYSKPLRERMLNGPTLFGESTSRNWASVSCLKLFFQASIHGESIQKQTAERACLVEPANSKDGMADLSNSFVKSVSIRDYETNSRCQCLIRFQLQHHVNAGGERHAPKVRKTAQNPGVARNGMIVCGQWPPCCRIPKPFGVNKGPYPEHRFMCI